MKSFIYVFCIHLGSFLYASAQPVKHDTLRTSRNSAGINHKVFNGRRNYSTFSIGVNVGVTSPFLAIGGTNATTQWQPALGYGISFREKLAHAFSLQMDINGGKVTGDDANSASGFKYNARGFSTTFYSGAFSGLVNVGGVDFVHRKEAVNFYLSAGAGLAVYSHSYIDASGISRIFTNKNGSVHIVVGQFYPVGGMAKFRLSDALAFNTGYTMNFFDNYNFYDLQTYPHKNHYSYGYGGLEYTFGTKSKPNLDWANAAAQLYDELYDVAIRKDIKALDGRIKNIEAAVNPLKKDSDGDGVPDLFDRCPNTPAGSVVDGSGCPVLFLKPSAVKKEIAAVPPAIAYSNILFEFDSSVLKASSYPVLDATAADLRANPGKTVYLDGYASDDEVKQKTVTADGYASTNKGNDEHSLKLANDRALAVKNYLINQGVYGWTLYLRSFGALYPIGDNTPEGNKLNRRVELKTGRYHFYVRVRVIISNAATTINNPNDLDKEVSQLNANPQLKIFIIGHTAEENAGVSATRTDLTLAQNRVNEVVKYLKGKGIKADRIIGEVFPVKRAKTDKDRKDDENVELFIF
ncbi:MAG TPA: OmpA family protein [Mucilaginibacter sp.]|jgi:OOP family OmpA-OmpF porin|nr:OmpA family protein [Mucilaginibacter sp.]